jgi:hypothetical protein
MGFFIKTSISSSTYVENQKQAAEMLGIKNGSKKAISARCRVLGYTVDFNYEKK